MAPSDFRASLAFSELLPSELSALTEHLTATLQRRVLLTRATKDEDRCGTDYWLTFPDAPDLPAMSVDIKVRAKDCRAYGNDDVALEAFGDLTHGVLGWALDDHKRTDLIVFYWRDSKRFAGPVPFTAINEAFTANYTDWVKRFRKATQSSTFGCDARIEPYESCVVFVPWATLTDAIACQFLSATLANSNVRNDAPSQALAA